MYCVLHLDMYTSVKWSWTLKPLSISWSCGVGPHRTPSQECSTCNYCESSIQWGNCSSDDSYSKARRKNIIINPTYYSVCVHRQACMMLQIGRVFPLVTLFVYPLLALGSIHSPKNTIGLTGSSVIRILVAPAGMVNPSW